MSKGMMEELGLLQDGFIKGRVSRREFLQALGIACVSAGLVGAPIERLVGSASAAGKSIRFDCWGGSVSEAFNEYAFKPFTKATGDKVVMGSIGNMEAYLSKVKASFPPGGEYNIAILAHKLAYVQVLDMGLGTVLDESKIPNLKYVIQSLLSRYRALSNGTLSTAPFIYGRVGIAYNTKYISKERAEKMGVALLWDKGLKGKLGSWMDWRTLIWHAALYTDQDPNNIRDMNAIWAALREQRGLFKKYWSSGAEFMSMMANEEFYAAQGWSGRVASLQEQGHPIGFVLPKNCLSWSEHLFVFKGTDLEMAHALLNFMLDPKCAIAVSQGAKYPNTIDPTKIEMPESVRKLPAFDPTGKLEGFVFLDPAYWKQHQVDWFEMVDRIRGGA